jgi:4-hydroxythreonine-4-phosphate dehydrogenase
MGTIFVSQGSDHSIGLEVFLKSFSCLSSLNKNSFVLVCNEDVLKNHLNTLNFDFSVMGNKLIYSGGPLNISFVSKNKSTAQDSLDSILRQIKSGDVLLTLPMNKEELYLNDKLCSGHTEYLRHHYKNADLGMLFESYKDLVLLLTDHIPLMEVPEALTTNDYFSKIELALKTYPNIEEVLFAGINPHAGENGTLGKEEQIFPKLITKLEKRFPKVSFKGPYPSDTIYQYRTQKIKQLYIFSYHDQGLNIFKERNRFLGLNITIGLPFKRLSVDHGTAPELVGKNKANYECSLLSLTKSLEMLGNK